MPGTILVSVLEFMDLPPSTPSSSILVKVSLGKREYQTWEKGDFSFPLTTLRDNLVLLLQDAEGNEISQAGIETKSIVEKGLWDDLFPLKTGGNVHMQFQFVLNQEERNRIRMMRESALKKKQEEFIKTSPSSLQATPSANEISDKNQETLSGIIRHQRVGLPGSESCEGKLVEMNEAQPLPPNVPSSAISADESSIRLRSSQSLPNHLEDRPHNLENQGPLKKTPSKIKKMISAFESGPAQDMKLRINPPPTKVQPNKLKADLKNQHLKEDKKVNTETALPISKGVVNPFPSGDLQLDKEVEINLLGDSGGGTKSSNDTVVNNSNKLSHLYQEVEIKKDTFREDFVRTSTTFEAVQVSEKILGKHRHQHSKKRNSSGNTVIGESQVESSSANTSQTIDILEASASANVYTAVETSGDLHIAIDIQEASTSANVCTSVETSEDRRIEGDSGPNVCRSVANCEDRHISFESSGVWIFPDEALRFCITTSDKKVRNFPGDCSLKPKIHQGRMDLSIPENVKKHNLDSGAGVEVNTNEKNQRRSKSTVENSEEAETSEGLVGQAIKVAVMIGFGTLVLLTRQRRNW